MLTFTEIAGLFLLGFSLYLLFSFLSVVNILNKNNINIHIGWGMIQNGNFFKYLHQLKTIQLNESGKVGGSYYNYYISFLGTLLTSVLLLLSIIF